MTEIMLNLPGKVFRSDMPWSIQYDEEGALIREFRESGISTVVVLTPGDEIIKNTGKDLLSLYRDEGWMCFTCRYGTWECPRWMLFALR